MLAVSAASLSRVATLSVTLAEPVAKVAEEGGVPSSTLPLSVTATATVSAAAVLPVRVSVNEAAVPSLTGEDAAAIDTTGSVGAAVAFVTPAPAKAATRLPAASRSGFAFAPVGTV